LGFNESLRININDFQVAKMNIIHSRDQCVYDCSLAVSSSEKRRTYQKKDLQTAGCINNGIIIIM